MRSVFFAMIVATLGACAATDTAKIEAPPQIHCTAGPFIVFFDRGSAELDSESREILGHVRRFATNICWDKSQLTIYGHNEAGEAASVPLARAIAARDYLISHGIAKNRIEVEVVGSNAPRKPAPAGIPERENRRIEMMFGVPRAAPALDTMLPSPPAPRQ